MFNYEAALILNRFQIAAAILRLTDRQEERDAGKEDGSTATQKEKDRADYVEQGVRRIREWERRVNGKG